MKKILSIKDHIDYFLDFFTKITKEEADFIEKVVEWEDEKRMAFKFAKRIFEEKTEKKLEIMRQNVSRKKLK